MLPICIARRFDPVFIGQSPITNLMNRFLPGCQYPPIQKMKTSFSNIDKWGV
jgi:hypothetical protein